MFVVVRIARSTSLWVALYAFAVMFVAWLPIIIFMAMLVERRQRFHHGHHHH